MIAKQFKSRSINTSQNILLYISGALVSNLGTYMYNVAIGLYVLSITGSGQKFALSIILGMIPRIILSPFAGVIADKINRKKMIVSTDIASGLLLTMVFLINRNITLSIGWIYFSSAMLTVFNTFFSISMSASIPNIVPKEKLHTLNATKTSIDAIASIAGPFIAGLLYSFVDIHHFILINGLSFIISGISEFFIRFNHSSEISTIKKQSVFSSLKEGVQYIKNHQLIFGLMKYILMINFIASLLYVYLPYVSVEVLHASPEIYGFIQIGAPIGFLIMSLIMSVSKPSSKGIFRTSSINFALFGLVMLLLSLPTNPLLSALSNKIHLLIIGCIAFLFGIVIIKINIPMQTKLQMIIEEDFRGRVNGVINMNAQLVMPIGILIYGYLLDNVPVYLIPLFSGILLITISVIMYHDKKLKNL